MFSAEELKTASIQMREARAKLDEYEALHGYGTTDERTQLLKNFNEATRRYMLMSNAPVVRDKLPRKK